MYKTSLVECKKETLIYKNTTGRKKEDFIYLYLYNTLMYRIYMYLFTRAVQNTLLDRTAAKKALSDHHSINSSHFSFVQKETAVSTRVDFVPQF